MFSSLIALVIVAAAHLGFNSHIDAAPAVVAPTPVAEVASEFDSSTAPFAVRFGDQSIGYRELLAPVLPGQTIRVEAASSETVVTEWTAGDAVATGANQWEWRAPDQAGIYPIRFHRGAESVVVNAAVMVPYGEMKNGSINGYHIGEYPARMLHGNPAYARPVGFIEVTEENAATQVSPHFQLEQFVCKSGAGYPKYIVLQPRLLNKLELLLDEANEKGYRAQTFHVMSAYRTPWYNKAIGNVTTFSRHEFGDAADIFVDAAPSDGVMDDLDHDGRHTRADAVTLSQFANAVDHDPELESIRGGLSAYAPNGSHGPFVHVDTRGFTARW